jgi:hypothetical protein
MLSTTVYEELRVVIPTVPSLKVLENANENSKALLVKQWTEWKEPLIV